MAIIDTGFVHAIWEGNSIVEDMTCYFVVVEQTETICMRLHLIDGDTSPNLNKIKQPICP